MELGDLEGKRIMHIDTSCKLYENKNTAIAFKIIKSNLHKGLVLRKKLKQELKRDLKINQDYARVYAICIYYLINEELDNFDILVICGDEDFTLVKKYLQLLFSKNKDYFNKKVLSISRLRMITGKNKLKSYADNIARSYRRRALRSLRKRQEGIELSVTDINYKKLKQAWIEIENLIKM